MGLAVVALNWVDVLSLIVNSCWVYDLLYILLKNKVLGGYILMLCYCFGDLGIRFVAYRILWLLF